MKSKLEQKAFDEGYEMGYRHGEFLGMQIQKRTDSLTKGATKMKYENAYVQKFKADLYESVKRVAKLTLFGLLVMIGTAFFCKAHAVQPAKMTVMCMTLDEVKSLPSDIFMLESFGTVRHFDVDGEVTSAPKISIVNRRTNVRAIYLLDSDNACLIYSEPVIQQN